MGAGTVPASPIGTFNKSFRGVEARRCWLLIGTAEDASFQSFGNWAVLYNGLLGPVSLFFPCNCRVMTENG
jgi:hypothetical protein